MNLPPFLAQMACRTAWAWLTGLIFAALLSPQPARAQAYEGAARLFSLPHVTVVYPARPAPREATNRLSAERRAAYLSHVWGLTARVVSDAELDELTLEDNVLVLGWDNRFFELNELGAPFVQDEKGWTFLGSIRGTPDEDLLFSHPSPLAGHRWVVFWSRIDLERDRFAVLPFLGSDWALYSDYRPLAQGMLRGEDSWPPQRNTAAERDLRTDAAALPVRERSAHYDLHVSPGALRADEIGAALAMREQALSTAIRHLGDPGSDFRIQLFVYADAEDKEARTGVPDPAHCLLEEGELHMLRSRALHANPHEDAHLVARAVIGPSYTSVMYEGLAVAAEQEGDRPDLALFAAALLERDTVLPLATLLDEERLRATTHQGIGFGSSGLTVVWLRESLDRREFRDLYGRQALEPADLAASLGLAVEKLQPTFESWLRQLVDDRRDEVTYYRSMDEAEQARAAGDEAGVVAAWGRALEVSPRDLELRYRRALLLIRLDRLEQARAELERVVDESRAPELGRFETFGHYQLGLVARRLGDEAEARRRFDRVLELPDRHGSHEMARVALASP